MAPASTSAKTLQQNRVRPVVPRPVLPAVPLSFVQKRKKENVAFVKPVEEKQTPIAEITSTESPEDETQSQEVNGVTESAKGDVEDTGKEELAPAVEGEAAAEEVSTKEAASVDSPKTTEQQTVTEDADNDTITTEKPPSTAPSSAPSTAPSRSTYQMPPPFVPASQMRSQTPSESQSIISHTNNPDPSHYPPLPPALNGNHHHAHPSQHNVVFAGYPDSNTSSPAPTSGQFLPPMAQQNGYPTQYAAHHASQLSSGGHPYTNNATAPLAPPPGYPRADVAAVSVDHSRRQSAWYPSEYSPIHTPHSADINAYDPPTPHSFQGSQDEHAQSSYNHYPTPNVNGFATQNEHYKQPRSKRPLSHAPVNFPVHPDGQPPLPSDHYDGLVPYLQAQFSNSDLSDCTVELRSTDERLLPAQVPGHRLILGRSPVLKEIMAKPTKSNQFGPVYSIISDSPYLRSDAFAMALQRLYGWPLVDHSVLAAFAPTFPGQPSPPHSAGSYEDRFGLGLAYAVVGHLLQIPPVVSRGLEIAAYHINWNTVSQALEFNFDNCRLVNGSSGDHPVPGPILDILHQAALNFLVTSFPAAFKLNTAFPDARSGGRLPIVPNTRSAKHSQQLSQIRFGELGGDEAYDAVFTTISKILVNSSFPLLKSILESSRLGNIQGGITPPVRQELMINVVDEREKRRVRVLASAVPNTERTQRASEWEAAGWQEYVEPATAGNPRPYLARLLTGFKK